MAINEKATGNDSVAITGTTSAGERTVGIKGIGDSVGVRGEGKTWHGVEGISDSTIGGFGVFGANTKGGTGVVGVSTGWHAVGGFADSESKGAGVYGEHKGKGAAVWGNNMNNEGGTGVVGTSKGTGVRGDAVGTGVIGVSKTWMGVYGETQSTVGGAGVWGEHKGNGTGVVGVSNSGLGVHGKGGRLAGFFEGDVEVTGDIRLINADCAEDFDICETEKIEPGTVMVLGEEGVLYPSQQAYDKRVAGVVSGAGNYRPGIVLDKQQSNSTRKPIALLGKAYCKVNAQYGAIEVGDLLTTSPTPGHAMKVDDPYPFTG
jgi:hypothetical protein